jgi:signal transduction histidine kinase
LSPTRSEIEKMLADRLEFLIGVGHDMRSPLTGIAGFATVLAELESVGSDPTASEAVAYIRKEAQRLVELLNQLLDFGQVEQGGPSLDREPIDLGRMARQAVEPWAARYPRVTFRLVEQGDSVVEGDFLKLHRVLANLLDNAVRHSPDGGTITVEVGGDNAEAFLSVTDEGAGVPVEDRERVFQRFVSLATEPYSKEMRKRGAGIGLYVVKGLVQAHGGSVYVEEIGEHGTGEQGSGARFVVRLPLRGRTDSQDDDHQTTAHPWEPEAVAGRDHGARTDPATMGSSKPRRHVASTET